MCLVDNRRVVDVCALVVEAPVASFVTVDLVKHLEVWKKQMMWITEEEASQALNRELAYNFTSILQ